MRVLFIAAYIAAGLSTAELMWILTSAECRPQPPVTYVAIAVMWPIMLAVDSFQILTGASRSTANQCGKTA